MKTAKYLSLLALALAVTSCGGGGKPSSPTTVDPTTGADPTTSVVDPTTSEDPTVPPYVGPKSVGMIGSFEASGWATDIPLSTEDNKIWVLENYVLADGDQVKFRANGSWDLQWNYTNVASTNTELLDLDGGNHNIGVTVDGYYTITLDSELGTIDFNLDEEIVKDPAVLLAEGIESHKAKEDMLAGYNLAYNQGWAETDTNVTVAYGKTAGGSFVEIGEPNYSGAMEYSYIGHLASGSLFSIDVAADGSKSKGYGTITEDSLLGYEANLLGYTVKAYNVTQVSAIIEGFIANNKQQDLEYVYDETTNTISVSLTYVTETSYPSLFDIHASYTFADGLIASLHTSWTQYYSSDITQDIETGIWYINDGVEASKPATYNYENIVGARTKEMPFDPDGLYYTSWELVDLDGNTLGDEITIESGVGKQFNFANAAPETADPAIDELTLECLGDNKYAVNGGYNSYNKVVQISSGSIGTHQVLLKTANVTKELTIHVVAPAPSNISGLLYRGSGTSYESTPHQNGETVTLYKGETVHFGATVTPYAANQEVVYSHAGEAISGQNGTITVWSSEKAVYSVTANEVGTGTVTIASAVNADIKCVLNIEVIEVASYEDIISTAWSRVSYGVAQEYVKFSPSAENNKVGTVSITALEYNENWEQVPVSYVYDYQYNEETKEFALSVDGAAATTHKLSISGTGSIVLTIVDDWGESSVTLSIDSPILYIAKEWSGWAVDTATNQWVNTKTVTLGLYEDGTASFNYNERNDSWETLGAVSARNLEYTFTGEGDSVVITLSASSVEAITAAGASSDAPVNITAVSSATKIKANVSDWGEKTYLKVVVTIDGAEVAFYLE